MNTLVEILAILTRIVTLIVLLGAAVLFLRTKTDWGRLAAGGFTLLALAPWISNLLASVLLFTDLHMGLVTLAQGTGNIAAVAAGLGLTVAAVLKRGRTQARSWSPPPSTG